jgi:hypothetical protein
MPMNLNEWMDRSFKNWLLVGAPIFLAVAAIVALSFHAARKTSWDAVLAPAFCLGLIQVASYGAMYFARKCGRAHKDLRPGALVCGIYFLAMGLLIIHYSVAWGFVAQPGLQSSYVVYSIFIVSVTFIFIIFRLPWKL